MKKEIKKAKRVKNQENKNQESESKETPMNHETKIEEKAADPGTTVEIPAPAPVMETPVQDPAPAASVQAEPVPATLPAPVEVTERVNHRGKPVSKSDQKDALKKYHELRKQGKSVDDASAAVGIPYITLRMWERKAKGEWKHQRRQAAKVEKTARKARTASKPRKRGRKAKVVENPTPVKATDYTELIVVTPDGLQVKCPNYTEAAKFVKEYRG